MFGLLRLLAALQLLAAAERQLGWGWGNSAHASCSAANSGAAQRGQCQTTELLVHENVFFCWCLLTLPEAVRTFCHAAECVNADPEIQNIPSDIPIIPTNAPCCQTQTTHDGDPGGIGGERNDIILKNKQKEV